MSEKNPIRRTVRFISVSLVHSATPQRFRGAVIKYRIKLKCVCKGIMKQNRFVDAKEKKALDIKKKCIKNLIFNCIKPVLT